MEEAEGVYKRLRRQRRHFPGVDGIEDIHWCTRGVAGACVEVHEEGHRASLARAFSYVIGRGGLHEAQVVSSEGIFAPPKVKEEIATAGAPRPSRTRARRNEVREGESVPAAYHMRAV